MNTRRFVLIAFVTLAVVAVVTTALRKPDKKVAGPVTVVVPRRNLHDSGPANQKPVRHQKKQRARGQSRKASSHLQRESPSAGPGGRSGRTKSPTRTGTNKRRVPSKKRKTPARKPQPSASSPSPPPASQSPPSSTTPSVTVPLPSVCVPPIKVGTC